MSLNFYFLGQEQLDILAKKNQESKKQTRIASGIPMKMDIAHDILFFFINCITN